MASTLRHALQARAVLALHIVERPSGDLRLWNQHQVQAADRIRLVSTERFPQQPLCPIPLDGPSDPPADRQSQANDVELVFGDEEDEQRSVEPEPLLEQPPKVRRAAKPLGRSQPQVFHRSGQSPPLLFSDTRLRDRVSVLERDALPALLPAPLQDEPASTGAHAHQETMCPLPLPVVWLIRALHVGDSDAGDVVTAIPTRGLSKGRSLATSPRDCQTRLAAALFPLTAL
jgi:hypothetical protein